MLRRTTLHLADHQRAFLFRFGCFQQLLKPGTHRIEESRGVRQDVEVFDINETIFKDQKILQMIRRYPKKLEHLLTFCDLSPNQIGLIYSGDELIEIAEPGSFRAVWECSEKLSIKVINFHSNYQIQGDLLEQLEKGLKLQEPSFPKAFTYIEVRQGYAGIVFINDEFKEVLTPGSYGFWQYNQTVSVELLNLSPQIADFRQESDIISKDEVNIGLGLSAQYQIIDADKFAAVMAHSRCVNQLETLDNIFTLFVKDVVASLAIHQCVEDAKQLSKILYHEGRKEFYQIGIDLSGIEITEVILPHDVSKLVQQVQQVNAKDEQLEFMEEQPLPQEKPEGLTSGEKGGKLSQAVLSFAVNGS